MPQHSTRAIAWYRFSYHSEGLISADEWEAWQETAYLFRSPANARRLLDAAAALNAGQGRQVELDTAE
jgi:antitoxin YefM